MRAENWGCRGSYLDASCFHVEEALEAICVFFCRTLVCLVNDGCTQLVSVSACFCDAVGNSLYVLANRGVFLFVLSPGPFLFLLAVASRRNANLAGGLAGRQQGRTNKTVTWWTELGQRLANAKMLVFTMTFQQSLELTKPWALAVQASNTTPWRLQECVRSMRAKLQTQLEQLQWLSHILQVLRLLQPYVPPNDVAAFFRAFFQEGATVGLYFAGSLDTWEVL